MQLHVWQGVLLGIHRQYAEAAADQGLHTTPSNSIQQHRARLLTLGIRLDSSSRNLPVRVGAIENVFTPDAVPAEIKLREVGGRNVWAYCEMMKQYVRPAYR